METMEVNGLYARINTPAALVGEALNRLPPHCLRPVYAVDEYPACPNNWMHGSSKSSSYFVPVQAGRGMWFDFTMNAGHKHEIAVVVSVQGVNPVTGKKVTELNLEQYREKCPIHKIDFMQDRFCSECGYKWPAQNYIATTTGETLWIDGFRNEKGEVRQYIITEDIARGIAAQVVGEDRVWAIGFAFYLSKEPRKVYEPTTLGFSDPVTTPAPWNGLIGDSYDGDMECLMADFDSAPSASYGVKGLSGPTGPTGCAGSKGVTGSSNGVTDPNSYNVMNMSVGETPLMASKHSSTPIKACSCAKRGASSASGSRVMRSAHKPVVQQKVLEIGAGARINQEMGTDPNSIDFWQPEPIGLIYCNYIDEETANRIISAGKRQDKKDGSLAGLKVGN